MSTFDSYDFYNDQKFIEFKNSTSVSFSGSEKDVDLKLKQRFYKKYVDPDYNPSFTSSPQPTSQNPQQSHQSKQSQTQSTNSNQTSNGESWKESFMSKLTSGEAAWLFLSLTLIFNAILYLIPLIGWSETNYSRTLYSATFIYLYSLIKSPNFRFSKDYIPTLLEDDNWNYFVFCLIFSFFTPHLLVVVPLLLYSILGVSYWIKRNSITFPFLRQIVPLIEIGVIQKYDSIMVWAAYAEFMLLPSLILVIFSTNGSVLATLYYSTFFKRRYRKSRYVQLIGHATGQKADSLVYTYLPASVYGPYQSLRQFLNNYLC